MNRDDIAISTAKKIAAESRKWTRRCDDAKRIPDAIMDFAPAMIADATQNLEAQVAHYRGLAERAVVALHIVRHAGLNKPDFADCREGLCADWNEAIAIPEIVGPITVEWLLANGFEPSAVIGERYERLLRRGGLWLTIDMRELVLGLSGEIFTHIKRNATRKDVWQMCDFFGK